MKFSRQGYWSGLSFPSPGDLPDPGIEPRSPHCRQILYHLSHQNRYCEETSSQVPGLLSRATSQHSGECWLLALGCHLVTRQTGSSRGCRSEGTPTKRCRLIGRSPLLTVLLGARSLRSAHFLDSGSVTTHFDS